ncbi:MAG: hypothetical protein M1838_001655 [Thelocarpon superellum]|nr:MAG: hypothetical protein M1838_001655 [Thelocarpon superellum]
MKISISTLAVLATAATTAAASTTSPPEAANPESVDPASLTKDDPNTDILKPPSDYMTWRVSLVGVSFEPDANGTFMFPQGATLGGVRLPPYTPLDDQLINDTARANAIQYIRDAFRNSTDQMGLPPSDPILPLHPNGTLSQNVTYTLDPYTNFTYGDTGISFRPVLNES